MSYGTSAAFQAAVYQHLRDDSVVSSLVGDNLFDAAPAGNVPDVYVSLGSEDVFAAGDKTGSGSRTRFTISVVGERDGFQALKTVAAAVSDALHQASPPMTRGRIVRLQFLKASARRVDSGRRRRIDMRFEARIEDD